MKITATPTTFQQIHLWRDMYRLEMACQIVHDSIHVRRGWTQEYLLSIGDTAVGYGSVAIGGPWTNQHALYEFYVIPSERLHLFELFTALLDASKPVSIEVQSNDSLATVMLHAFAPQVISEAVLFHDRITTTLVVLSELFPRDKLHIVDDDHRGYRWFLPLVTVFSMTLGGWGCFGPG